MGRGCIPSADGGVAVLGDLLVGLLGSTRGGLLDLLTDEVGTLLDRIHCDRLVWLFEEVVVKLKFECG